MGRCVHPHLRVHRMHDRIDTVCGRRDRQLHREQGKKKGSGLKTNKLGADTRLATVKSQIDISAGYMENGSDLILFYHLRVLHC